MDYVISFLEGIISFISPCLLPILPIYISFFAGQNTEGQKKDTLRNSISFVFGFTIVFVLLGAFAGALGGVLQEYKVVVNIVVGIIMILFGFNIMGQMKVPFINKNKQLSINMINSGFLSSMLFGLIFSVSWTPCVGVFLGSALMLAASSGESLKGIIMLLCFSLGLGIPFIISAFLIYRLNQTFTFIKKNYSIINYISGGFLIVVGILMITGLMNYFISILTF